MSGGVLTIGAIAARTKVQLLADRRSREMRRAIGIDFRRAREDQGISARRLAGAAGIDATIRDQPPRGVEVGRVRRVGGQ